MQGQFDGVAWVRIGGVTRVNIYLQNRVIDVHADADHDAAMQWLADWKGVAQ